MAYRLLSILSLGVLTARSAVIVPGATWTDTSGTVIQAHGGGILKVLPKDMHTYTRLDASSQVGSTFYWHGEDKSHNSGLFKAVSCYSVRISLEGFIIAF